MKALPMHEIERKQKSIPPLSQSRHGDMACETLYVCKHVQGTGLGESEPAARGIEIHEVLASVLALRDSAPPTFMHDYRGWFDGLLAEASSLRKADTSKQVLETRVRPQIIPARVCFQEHLGWCIRAPKTRLPDPVRRVLSEQGR